MLPVNILICETCQNVQSMGSPVCTKCGEAKLAQYNRSEAGIIKRLRTQKRMKQGDLAMACGVRQPNLSRIENGITKPRKETLERIAQALGVELAMIVVRQ